MRALLLLLLSCLALSQVPSSTYNVTGNPNQSPIWQQLQKKGFTAQSGLCGWYYSNNKIWLYLFSDSLFSEFVLVQVEFEGNLDQDRDRFAPKRETMEVYFDYYQQMKRVDSVLDYDLSSSVDILRRTLSIKHEGVDLEVKLVNQSGTTKMHLLLILLFLVVKTFAVGMKENNKFKFSEEQTSKPLKSMVFWSQIFWFGFLVANVIILPDIPSVRFLAFVFGCYLLALGVAAPLNFIEAENKHFRKESLCEKIQTTGLMFLLLVFAFWAIISNNMVLVTTPFAIGYTLLPLLQVRLNCSLKTRNPIGPPSLTLYITTVMQMIYFLGCPGNLLSHPLNPFLVKTILFTAIILIGLIYCQIQLGGRLKIGSLVRAIYLRLGELFLKQKQDELVEEIQRCQLCGEEDWQQEKESAVSDSQLVRGRRISTPDGLLFHIQCLKKFVEANRIST